ncbi:hypothetical protein Tco_0387665, partial [Tanacetum coccineum]
MSLSIPGGIESSRERNALVSSKRKSISSKGVREGERDSMTGSGERLENFLLEADMDMESVADKDRLRVFL